MKINKKEIKRLIIPTVIIIIIFSIMYYIIMNIQLNKYKNIFNMRIDAIISKIKEEYPEADEKEIINIIQDSGELDNKYLKQYGYEENEEYIEELEKEMHKNIKINIILIISFGIVIMIIYLIYISKQNSEIKSIDGYLKKINKGNYDLKIEENYEDEISKLRNELYKTTVLLRETAEINKKENINLSIAIEDISHQLKTPLTSISIMIDNLYENPDMDNETRRDFLETIRKQIEWISSLVISILKIAKFDSGTIVMNDKLISAEKLINEVIENLSIMIEIKEIEIVKKIQKGSNFVADYKWQLEALTNILKNSIEHSKEKSKIFVEIEDSSVFLKIVIRDEGEGISKKELKHIFERFYKSKNSSEDSIGIGLALAKTIIEKDNGYITVNSEEGKGTTFEIKYIK